MHNLKKVIKRPLLILDEGADLIVISHKAEVKVSVFRQEQNAQIQAASEFKILSKRAQADAGVQMWPPECRFQPRNGGIDGCLLLERKRIKGAPVFWPRIDHGFQGLRRPPLRSFLIPANSR